MSSLMELRGGAAQWLTGTAANVSQVKWEFKLTAIGQRCCYNHGQFPPVQSSISRHFGRFLDAVEQELKEEFIGWYATAEERDAASTEFFQKSKIRHVQLLGVLQWLRCRILASELNYRAHSYDCLIQPSERERQSLVFELTFESTVCP